MSTLFDNLAACSRFRFVLCVALLPGCLGLSGCWSGGKNTYVAPPPPKVTVARPLAEEIVETREYTGTARAFESVEIHARVEGFLEALGFEDGDQVQQGQLLARIDPRPYEAALAQAKASVELAKASRLTSQAGLSQAQARLANSQAELHRLETAQQRSPGSISQSEIDLTRTTVMTNTAQVEAANAAIASSEAQIAAAEAQVTQANLNLSYTEVQSPIAGRIAEKNFNVGSLVGKPGATLLTTVVRYDPVYAYFTISEADLLIFRREQLARDDDSPATTQRPLRPLALGLGDEEGFPHTGYSDYADISLDETTGTFMARGRFENPQNLILPGSFVRIQVPLDKRSVLLINETAVCKDQAGAFVLVVNEKNVVETRRVTLGTRYQQHMIVTGGELQATDRVVVSGLQMSRPGATVEPVEESASLSGSSEDPSPEYRGGGLERDAAASTEPAVSTDSAAGQDAAAEGGP